MNAENIKRRIGRKIDDMGENFTLNGLSGTAYRGLFHILDNSLINLYMDDAESLSLIRPALRMTVKPQVNIAADDVIVRQGVNYKVKKFFTYRIGGSAIYKTAVLSEYET